jgi:hypothetical protein|tara:strand:+ start:1554 stop:2234 length:681 start_codon:yes stop_codon:yes gene_type:complete
MLCQRLGLSLPTLKRLGGWSPINEDTLEAWYQNAVGITLNGSDVSQWADSSTNSYDMVQATASEQPAYSAGVLTFVPTDTNNLQTTGQISLSSDFTIGIKLTPSAFNNVVLADNTTVHEFFKITNSSQLRIRMDSSGNQANLDLDSGTFGDDYLVITRVSDVLTLWQNGVVQTGTTPTLSGTTDIDAIGVRRTDLNAYAGDIKEIQIYSTSSAALTANVNDRLSTL